MLNKTESAIIKFDSATEQNVEQITKIVGLTKAKYLVPIIDNLDLDANPRSSKTGPVTDAIQDSIETAPDIFPFKTKGVLLAASRYERLDRGRVRIDPENREIEGILDGGHNVLAIGLYILRNATEFAGASFPKGQKTWDQFKQLWQDNRDRVDNYLNVLKKDPSLNDLDFYVPVELLIPRDGEDLSSSETFKNNLLEICAARNNNVQLPISAKANQLGYFDDLKTLMDRRDPRLSGRIEWKPNDGGDIKAQDIVALAWIPLNLITPVKDEHGRTIGSVLAQSIFSGKGSCLKQFEKLMSSPYVTVETGEDYKRELRNPEVASAFKIAVELPELYDYIFEKFPELYNAAGGSYGRITAVKNLNNKIKNKVSPFTKTPIGTVSPDGYIVPLVYGLQALMENREINGRNKIRWTRPPQAFLQENLGKIVAHYVGIFSMCDYDPQKIGKNSQSYAQALAGFKMAIAGIL